MLSLALLVTLSMGSEAIALSFCPHMSGESCPAATLTKEVHSDSVTPEVVSETPHCHSERSGMQESGVQPRLEEEVVEAGSESEPASDLSETNANSAALALPDEDCGRCMMHSESIPAISSRAAVQPGNSHELAAAECSAETFKSSPLDNPILDLHDHGPPGNPGARYLLINVFRI